MRFVSFLSGGFITEIVVNLPERKLAKRTSVHCAALFTLTKYSFSFFFNEIFVAKLHNLSNFSARTRTVHLHKEEKRTPEGESGVFSQ